MPEKATSPVEVIQEEKRGVYYANADKSFDPSLVLLTFQGKGFFFGPQNHLLVADTSVKLVADIVYNLELQYDLNGLNEVKDAVEEPDKDSVKTPVKYSLKDLKGYKLKSQFISENPESSNLAFESLSSNETLQNYIEKLNGTNLSIPLLNMN